MVITKEEFQKSLEFSLEDQPDVADVGEYVEGVKGFLYDARNEGLFNI